MSEAETLVALLCSCGREYRIPASKNGDTFQCDCYMRIVVDTTFLREVPPAPVPSTESMYESTTEVFTWIQPETRRTLRPTIEPPRRCVDEERLYERLDRVVDALEQVEIERLERLMQPLVDECVRLERENAKLARLVDAARDRGRVDLDELLARAARLRGVA